MRIYVNLTHPMLDGHDIKRVYAPVSALQHVLAVGIYKGSLPLVHVPLALVQHMSQQVSRDVVPKVMDGEPWLDLFSAFVPCIPVATAVRQHVSTMRMAFVMRPDGAMQKNVTHRRRFRFKAYDAECDAAGCYAPSAFEMVRECVYTFVPPPIRLQLIKPTPTAEEIGAGHVHTRHSVPIWLPSQQQSPQPRPQQQALPPPVPDWSTKDNRHQSRSRPLTFIASMVLPQQCPTSASRNTSTALYKVGNA